jgi:MtN3 and saliva related transmembrane protein
MWMFLLLTRQLGGDDLVISLIGVAAAVLTTSSFVPQIIRAYKTKSMEDVSPYLMSIFGAGTLLWMIYGVYRSDIVIIAANATATGLNVILLYFKFHYRTQTAMPG